MRGSRRTQLVSIFADFKPWAGQKELSMSSVQSLRRLDRPPASFKRADRPAASMSSTARAPSAKSCKAVSLLSSTSN